MKVYINGEPRESSANTVAQLVEELGLPGPALLVEHNGTALRRDEWSTQNLAEGDRLEILRIAAGG
ncbi:MAG: sulfur carrier protein ThiS [Verrucomicrobiaceae bacterium]|nr:MAG: sulfur carrier protein ThiS [Verrucomicrobiaceae bacterium]